QGAELPAPLETAGRMAARVNAMIAPVVPYGVTGILDAYAGSFSISEKAYRAYMSDVLEGLARQGFRNIIVVNGHGGPQTAILNELAEQAGRAHPVRTLGVNRGVYFSDITLETFGEVGGHVGWNHRAVIQEH